MNALSIEMQLICLDSDAEWWDGCSAVWSQWDAGSRPHLCPT